MIASATGLAANHQGAVQGGFPLAMASTGEQVRVVALSGGDALEKRLAAMGLGLGSEFALAQREGAAGAVISLASTRLALSLGMLHRIRVVKV
ncbi:hypothetical protein BI364_03330 [Acidihalobacter yilgarnensis]|uniref:Ferrous iron transporter FeoA-like domain-containing protein n=1 Tax=Acidihalobacter yilgarnensis TaxID=2819280 RepID=A0A1D8IL12_9GAMM|nr:FeoA family protein [Acidihalobacter yilgarnensis]AOU97162.1 hypothetical protein BI364_03330 [Acidihalobacter yilgarnensis]